MDSWKIFSSDCLTNIYKHHSMKTAMAMPDTFLLRWKACLIIRHISEGEGHYLKSKQNNAVCFHHIVSLSLDITQINSCNLYLLMVSCMSKASFYGITKITQTVWANQTNLCVQEYQTGIATFKHWNLHVRNR